VVEDPQQPSAFCDWGLGHQPPISQAVQARARNVGGLAWPHSPWINAGVLLDRIFLRTGGCRSNELGPEPIIPRHYTDEAHAPASSPAGADWSCGSSPLAPRSEAAAALMVNLPGLTRASESHLPERTPGALSALPGGSLHWLWQAGVRTRAGSWVTSPLALRKRTRHSGPPRPPGALSRSGRCGPLPGKRLKRYGELLCCW